MGARRRLHWRKIRSGLGDSRGPRRQRRKGAARQLLDNAHAQTFHLRYAVAEPQRRAMPLILRQVAFRCVPGQLPVFRVWKKSAGAGRAPTFSPSKLPQSRDRV